MSDDIRTLNPGKYDKAGKRIRPPAEHMADNITRQEAMDHIGVAVAAATKAAYEEIDDAIGDRLEAIENGLRHEMHELIARGFYRRSLRGRLEAVKLALRDSSLGGWLIELGLLEPPLSKAVLVVDAVDVLDPNVAAAAAKIETLPLRWREFAGWTDEAKAWMESGGVVLVPTPRKKGVDEAGRIAAGTTAILQHAIDLLIDDDHEGGVNLEAGVTVLALDEELFEAARALCTEVVQP